MVYDFVVNQMEVFCCFSIAPFVICITAAQMIPHDEDW